MTTAQRSSGPTRHRVDLPTSGHWPRAGKIRLGTATLNEAKTKEFGREIYTPQKAKHFVVREDESGITSPEAARAFAARYGAEPTAIGFLLMGETPDDVLEGAWRFYGTGKLKRRCDGELCAERTQTGRWADVPCVCKAQGIAPTSREHCTLTYQISLILPDVAVPGVWQLDTGSEISSRAMADWLEMMFELRQMADPPRGLKGLIGTLRLVETKVAPEGRTSTVYVLKPEATEVTVKQLLSGGGSLELEPGTASAELPPPAADEAPEPTLDRSSFADEQEELDPEAGLSAEAEAEAAVADPADSDDRAPLPISDQIKALTADDKARLKHHAASWTYEKDGETLRITTTPSRLAWYIGQHYPGELDVIGLLDQLDILDEAGA